MSPLAITYRTGERRSALRTVVVDEVRESIVLLPSGSLLVLMAKLIHGTSCRHAAWAEWLGADPDSDDFIIPAESVVAKRPIAIAVRATHKRSA
jgi:hypothetical protein